MKAQRNGIFRYILLLVLLIMMVRLLPVIVRMIQAVTMGARAYWWLILPVLIISWVSGLVYWRMFRRWSVAKKSGYQFEGQRLRDVTDSAKDRSD